MKNQKAQEVKGYSLNASNGNALNQNIMMKMNESVENRGVKF